MPPVRNVAVGSSFLWRDREKVGLHFLCEHLLDKGCRLEWFTIPLSLLHFVKPRIAKAKWPRLRFSLAGGRREARGATYIVNRVPLTLVHPIPRRPPLDSHFVSRNYLRWRLPPVTGLARRDGVSPVDMVFFDCGGIDLYYPFRDETCISMYRINDFVAEFPGQSNGRVQSERQIIREADVLLLVNDTMYDEVVQTRGAGTGVHVLPNGVDLELFSGDVEPPLEYGAIPEPRAVFAGAISTWFDWDLILQVARLRPGISFCIIGRGQMPNAMPENVFHLGSRPHDQIAAFLQHSSVGLIPFKDLVRTRRVDRPLKFYEYIASGLPVVNVPFGNLAKMAPHAVFGASPEEFAAAIDVALSFTCQDRTRLREEAKRFSWRAVYHRFDTILAQEGISLP